MSTDACTLQDPSDVASPTYVHPKETSGILHESSTYRAYRLKPVITQYVHAERALRLSPSAKHKAQLSKMSTCRDGAFFVQHTETLEVRVASKKCNTRWCPLCAGTRRAVIVPAVARWLETVPAPKFFTVTMQHSSAPLADQVQRLYDAFRRLRRLKWWRDRVDGGIWFFQVKRSKGSGQWHPHIHALLDAAWLDHHELRRHWEYLTRGSTIVDIRGVRDVDKAAEYVARYATTPADLRAHPDADKVEIVTTFDSMRIAGTWGTAKGTPLRPQKQADWFKWKYCVGFYAATLRQFRDTVFRDLLRAWLKGKPCPYQLYFDDGPGTGCPQNTDRTPEPAPFLPGFYDQPQAESP